MKNLIVNKGQSCERCNNDMIFQVTTPVGADFHTCPLCGNWTDDLKEEELDLFLEELECLYCKRCNIVYYYGCSHAVNGCTDDLYYGKIVTSYTYQGNVFNGMPQFESIEECTKLLKESQLLLNWECMCIQNSCKGCPKAYYPTYHRNCKCL